MHYTAILQVDEKSMSAGPLGWDTDATSTQFGDHDWFSSPVIETSDPELKWVEASMFVGEGRWVVEGGKRAIEYEIYRVRPRQWRKGVRAPQRKEPKWNEKMNRLRKRHIMHTTYHEGFFSSIIVLTVPSVPYATFDTDTLKTAVPWYTWNYFCDWKLSIRELSPDPFGMLQQEKTDQFLSYLIAFYVICTRFLPYCVRAYQRTGLAFTIRPWGLVELSSTFSWTSTLRLRVSGLLWTWFVVTLI